MPRHIRPLAATATAAALLAALAMPGVADASPARTAPASTAEPSSELRGSANLDMLRADVLEQVAELRSKVATAAEGLRAATVDWALAAHGGDPRSIKQQLQTADATLAQWERRVASASTAEELRRVARSVHACGLAEGITAETGALRSAVHATAAVQALRMHAAAQDAALTQLAQDAADPARAQAVVSRYRAASGELVGRVVTMERDLGLAVQTMSRTRFAVRAHHARTERTWGLGDGTSSHVREAESVIATLYGAARGELEGTTRRS